MLIRHSVVKRSTLVDLREGFLDEPRAMLGARHVERRATAEALKPVAQPCHRLLLVAERGCRLCDDARETDRLVGFLLRQAFVRLATMAQRATRNDEGQLVGFQPALGQTVDHRDVDAGARQLGKIGPDRTRIASSCSRIVNSA